MLSRPARICLAPTCRQSYDGSVHFGSVEEVERALEANAYLADRGLATAVHLALAMRRPLLREGEAGVGLRAARARHARGASLRRHLPERPQPRQPRSARAHIEDHEAPSTLGDTHSPFSPERACRMGYPRTRPARTATGLERPRPPNSPFSRLHRHTRSTASHVGALAAQEPVAAQFGRKVRPRRNPVFDHRAHCQIQLAKVLAGGDATRRRKAGHMLGQRQRPAPPPPPPLPYALQNLSTTSAPTRTRTASQSRKALTHPENASTESDARRAGRATSASGTGSRTTTSPRPNAFRSVRASLVRGLSLTG